MQKLTKSSDLRNTLNAIRRTSNGRLYFNKRNTRHTIWLDGVPITTLRQARLLSFCDGWKWRETLVDQPLSFNKMTVQTGVIFVLRQLTELQMDYAGHPDRKEYRGFAALHDKLDANMLLPFAEDYNAQDELANDFYTQVMAGVTKYLCDMWDINYKHITPSEKDTKSP